MEAVPSWTRKKPPRCRAQVWNRLTTLANSGYLVSRKVCNQRHTQMWLLFLEVSPVFQVLCSKRTHFGWFWDVLRIQRSWKGVFWKVCERKALGKLCLFVLAGIRGNSKMTEDVWVQKVSSSDVFVLDASVCCWCRAFLGWVSGLKMFSITLAG